MTENQLGFDMPKILNQKYMQMFVVIHCDYNSYVYCNYVIIIIHSYFRILYYPKIKVYINILKENNHLDPSQ